MCVVKLFVWFATFCLLFLWNLVLFIIFGWRLIEELVLSQCNVDWNSKNSRCTVFFVGSSCLDIIFEQKCIELLSILIARCDSMLSTLSIENTYLGHV